jgi:hypothetical protein
MEANIMQDLHVKPLTDEDRKRNRYLDSINHAPYFTILLIVLAAFSLFTLAVLLGVF